ncbi:tumor protein p63-regulated 1 protein isoform B [Alligator mississippiensis]|uniref:Tumor protein p63-regulated 1 protein isoform B n=1 Tax=Alligator mississippiensis TaxID=8496 RepID=A0A151MM27_ALLMI|nr:tumor protein p63-regulated 1 protein isoform B [Alligator mississippiensis]
MFEGQIISDLDLQALSSLALCSLGRRRVHPTQVSGGSGPAHLEQAVDMLEEENNQEFETEELEEKHGGDVPEPRLATDVRDPSASATSASYPRPHVKQVIARKFFVTRPGAFDQAIEDINTHVVENAGETVDSFWLLTEVDHWNNEKERIVVITDSALLVCKYNFIMLSCLQVQRIPLSHVDRVCIGQFTFPERSLSKREGEGLRIHWDNLKEPSFLSRWNPWSTEVPYVTFMEHPVKGSTQRFGAICQMSMFSAQLVQAIQKAQRKNPPPGNPTGVVVLNQPLLIDTHVGLMSFLGNHNKLGYAIARGSFGF